MPVDATWRIQSNSALVTSTTGFTASLPNPTTNSSTLLLYAGTNSNGSIALSQNVIDPPWYQDKAVASVWYAWRRDNQPAGETSWSISPVSALSAPWYWYVEEWGGLSTVGQPDATQATTSAAAGHNATVYTDGDGAGASVGGGAATADVNDFLARAVFSAQGGAGTFPAGHSYGAGEFNGPSGWTESAYLVSGTGSASGDFVLAIAEAYPGASGTIGGSLAFSTAGGGTLPTVERGWAVCYQPAAAPPPTGILTS